MTKTGNRSVSLFELYPIYLTSYVDIVQSFFTNSVLETPNVITEAKDRIKFVKIMLKLFHYYTQQRIKRKVSSTFLFHDLHVPDEWGK